MIGIIDYKAGNAPSVIHAVKHLGYKATLIHNPNDLNNVSHIILPGVGSAKATMNSLNDMNIINALEETVLNKKVFFLGICVGMQILFEHSEEENTICLGWLEGNVKKFDASMVRVPQMGWNQVNFFKNSPCKTSDDFFYFVNSYYVKPKNKAHIWGLTNYNGQFTSAVQHKNIFATQFHVEKSGLAGLMLLNEFLSLKKEG